MGGGSGGRFQMRGWLRGSGGGSGCQVGVVHV